MQVPSVRAQVVTRRTYSRPKDEAGTSFETWEETVDRAIGHQRWLWERAQGHALLEHQEKELKKLKKLMLKRKVFLAGRTLWLGGTDVAKKRQVSQFNCCMSKVATVFDLVDHFWMLLQGCGVSSWAEPGIINGFAKEVEEIRIIRSQRTVDEWKNGIRGNDLNAETFYVENEKRVWHLTVGDSAEAWAKALGKIVVMKRPVEVIVLDFSQVRASGIRLKGYGWISSGDQQIARAFENICKLLSRKANQLLNRIDLLDLENWIGTTLSSRRSAELIHCAYNDEMWEEFALAKRNHYPDNVQRAQSNNSLVFFEKPSKAELYGIFYLMKLGGGSEPGFINGKEARRRAPWWAGVNPCGEALLGDRSLCNLVETVLCKFNGDFDGLLDAHRLVARANYRQTCVNLKDGILSDSWHELNEYLRLTGAGITGYVAWESQNDPEKARLLREAAHDGVDSMADELGLQRSKLTCLVKPSGTLGKVADCSEGIHKPLGRYIFNNIGFSEHDPLVPILKAANYRTMENPYDSTSVLVTFPVKYDDIEFSKVETDRGIVEANQETAIEQLERYKFLMEHYVDHNASITVSYSPEEVPEIVDWIYANWDSFVGVSFLYRNDPTKTAADLGYAYLPQEVKTEAEYNEYVASLLPVILDQRSDSFDELMSDECASGACPVR